jgi:hypothetical protein
MTDAGLFVAFAAFGLAAPLVLYLLIRDETRERREMSRADAESYARERAGERYGQETSDRD